MTERIAIVGWGMCSPGGMTAAQHVFLLRAGLAPHTPSPFVKPDGERLEVRYCPWIGAHAPFVARVTAMATSAIDEAMPPHGEVDHLVTCWSGQAPWCDDERREVERDLQLRCGASATSPLVGKSLAAAIGLARERVADGAVVMLLTSHSMIDGPALGALAARPPTPWERPAPAPGEGGAALLLCTPATATRLQLEVLAHLDGCEGVAGAAHDDNQEIADGVALSQVLRRLPKVGPIGMVCGQLLVDELRENEWLMALPRNAQRFEVTHASHCLESEIGRVGAASELLSLTYGLALLHYEAEAGTQSDALLTWAITSAGIRSACIARIER